MMISFVKTIFFGILFCFGLYARSDIVLAPLFCDHVVLQREKPVPVWGRADPGERVEVQFGKQVHSTVADDMGYWRIILAPMSASGSPEKLTAKGKNIVVVNDVLVGEVWLCSGQSNMDWVVQKTPITKEDLVAADLPLVRQFKASFATAALPCDELEGAWTVSDTNTVRRFGAVAYYFGQKLFSELNVPIGLINSSYSGTQIEGWISTAALAKDPSWPEVIRRWQESLAALPAQQAAYPDRLEKWERDSEAAKKAGKPYAVRRPALHGLGGTRQPGALFNAMICPLIPAAFRGVIWYQGETNAGRHVEYKTLFPTLIRQWRADFSQGAFPFYFVQLANYNVPRETTGTQWAFLREAQESGLTLENTGMAVAVDIGDPDNIHPENKKDVGYRLALIALAKTYGKTVEFAGPRFANFERQDKTLTINFVHADGLKSKTAPIEGFQLAGSDRRFYPAEARITGEKIVVSSEQVREPIAVRYAWGNNPPAPLYNGAGLPAVPFRSDNWDK